MSQDQLQQAFRFYQAGQLEPAVELLRGYLARFPFDAPANHLLGGICYRLGKLDSARDHLVRACAAPGARAEMFNDLGAALNGLGDQTGAIAAYERALAMEPNHAVVLSNLAVVYRAQGQPQRAIAALRRALAINPNLTEAQANLRNTYRDIVSPWHFPMINDRPRNDAYHAAITHIVPGRRVLDVGTGTGLLAMMAAKAGAASVAACEADPVIADHAREIVALNGLSDRIRVIAKHSTALAVGSDLPQRANVLITETFSSDLLSEGILASLEHAHRELLTEDAVVIPRRATALAYLAGGANIEALLFAGNSHGFDLAPFNDFAPSLLPVTLDNVPHDTLSGDFELFSFDLRSKNFPVSESMISVPVTRSGVASVLVQWIRLELDEAAHYENRPLPNPQAENHWTQILHRLPQPVRVEAGGTVRLIARHNRQQISISIADYVT
ncbi:MAG: tetratricopeptide repeat protein [Alphaproteobacteria bacterium]|nr:tetratricopeptide repeat protein [Alphaproteobacteria bacterium]